MHTGETTLVVDRASDISGEITKTETDLDRRWAAALGRDLMCTTISARQMA